MLRRVRTLIAAHVSHSYGRGQYWATLDSTAEAMHGYRSHARHELLLMLGRTRRIGGPRYAEAV